jgi:hypothetical protein
MSLWRLEAAENRAASPGPARQGPLPVGAGFSGCCADRKVLAPCHLVENADRTKCCDAVVFSIRANTRRTHCSKVPCVFDDLVRARKQYRWNDQSE